MAIKCVNWKNFENKKVALNFCCQISSSRHWSLCCRRMWHYNMCSVHFLVSDQTWHGTRNQTTASGESSFLPAARHPVGNWPQTMENLSLRLPKHDRSCLLDGRDTPLLQTLIGLLRQKADLNILGCNILIILNSSRTSRTHGYNCIHMVRKFEHLDKE